MDPKQYGFLQLFAGDDVELIDDKDDNTGEDGDVDLDDSDYDDIEDQHGAEYGDEEEPSKEEEEPSKEEEPQKEEEDSPPEPEKKVQTPEENAKFAEMRRQKQLQAELERLKAESPEFQLAQKLAAMYGTTPDIMLQQIEQEAIRKEAERRNVPIEQIQAERATQAELQNLRNELARVQFENWKTRIESEATSLKQEHPYLTDDELQAAKLHLLQTNNPDGSLESAVYALHGKKIAAAVREAARQEALAEISGRKPGPANLPSGKSPNQTQVLTPEERYIAKQMGMTEAEYIKYKL